MNTQQRDELITRFMGGDVIEEHTYEMPHGSHSEGVMKIWKIPKGTPNHNSDLARIGIFRYHWSWDALMPVVREICLMPLTKYEDCRELQKGIEELSIFSERDVVIDKVTNFIKYYNDVHQLQRTQTT